MTAPAKTGGPGGGTSVAPSARDEGQMKLGTKVEVAFAPTVGSEIATVRRPLKKRREIPTPGKDWSLVEFADGRRMWSHNSALVVVA